MAGDLILRGLSRDNVLITVDSNKTYCACPNRMDPPAFHVSSQQIEGVTIRPGPFTLDQGATVGGAIAVKTRQAAMEPFGSLYGYAGSFNYWAGGLAGGGAVNNTPLSLQGGLYYQTGGVYKDGNGMRVTELPGTNYRPDYRSGDAFSILDGEAKASYLFQNESVVSLSYGFQDAKDVIYPGLRMDATRDTLHRGSIGYLIPVSTGWGDELSASLSFSHVDHDMVDSFRMTSQMSPIFAERGYMMRTVAETQYIGGMVKVTKDLSQAQWRYGLDLSQRRWNADNQIMMLENHMIPDVEIGKLGFWSVYEQREGPWSWEVSARLDVSRSEAKGDISFLQSYWDTTSNTMENVLPSAYVLLNREFDSPWSVYGGVGHGTRVPDPQERYINLNRPPGRPDWVGNPDLNPVRSTEIQIGSTGSLGDLQVTGSAFHAWLTDYIYLRSLRTSLGNATSYENVDARLYGFSVDGYYPISEEIRMDFGLAWQEGLKASQPGWATNRVLAEVPPLRSRLALTYVASRGFIRAEVSHQDDLRRVDPDLNEKPIEGWIALDLSGGWQLTDWLTLSGGIDNALDEDYAVSNAFVRDPFSSGVEVTEPGRFLFARISADY